jgi:putative endonuclease
VALLGFCLENSTLTNKIDSVKIFYVYILKCSDGSYYTGVTSNIERRIFEHETGIDPRAYTYKRRPVEIVYYNYFQDPIQAITFEKQIKKWIRKKKEALIQENIESLKKLAACKNETSHNFLNSKNNFETE